MDFFNKLEKHGLLLNEKQKEAITHTDGPILVAAGPGSGKTSVITARTAYLIQKASVDPSSIMVITFTRAAANEMKLRFAGFPGTTAEHSKKVEFGTFHSVFYKIICSYYGRYLPVLEPLKAFTIIKKILKSINEPFDDDIIQNTLNEISIFRTVVEEPDNFTSQLYSNSRFSHILDQYEKQKRLLKAIDFDDMMIMCMKILESDENFLLNYRDKYRYFLVDEFQDTCRMQYEIIRLLSYPRNNICVVGDDDQSIYGFRGAMHDCLIRFENHYTHCNSVILDINYRSTEEIVEISKKIINNNTLRKNKELKSVNGHGEKAVFISPSDEESEAVFIADSIENMHKNGTLYRNFSVLYRTNIQSRPVIDELIKRDIPFNVRDRLSSFYEHWVCRDLTYYLKLALNNNDRFSLLQVINRPVRYLPKDYINRIVQNNESNIALFQQIQNSNELKDFQLQKIRELEKNLKSIKYLSPSVAVNFVRKTIAYDDYIKKHCMEYGISHDELFNILDEYEVSSSGFKSIPDFLSHINEVSLKLKKDDKVNRHYTDSVTLSTIHGAKGLEFPFVCIIGCIEGCMPHSKCMITGENIEEERRLLYVAVTRAKTNVIISSPRKHHGKTVQPSRFLDEISEVNNKHNQNNLILTEFRTGDLVSHRTFGTGKIIKINGKSMDIKFNGRIGIKTLDIKICIENKLVEK